MPPIQTTFATTTAKLVASAAKLLRLGAGTSLPGKIARKLDPHILQNLGKQIKHRTIAVTGTNGKTTTCGLLAQFFRESGNRVVHNHLGANMVPGITAALVSQTGLNGHLSADTGILEVDEASLTGVAQEVSIQHIAVTNLFRDQLDRYGELDTTAKLIADGIAHSQVDEGGSLYLNADDPMVTAIAN
ncbi:MAG: hypothetical protein KTR14_09195, partial [Vampirovibrio sp.]|nr:hypothetical protein [Vampirovibrio sp.]